MGSIEEKSSNKMFGGLQKVYTHDSSECKTKMTFGVFLPPRAENESCPVLYFLSGLTCTEQNVITKGGAQRVAAELGIIVVAPDTSPRGCNIDGEDDSYDFGSGAGFYVDATTDKWKSNYRMYSYVTEELLSVVNANFPTQPDRISIFGHSMGGHGALICALKNPGLYRSVLHLLLSVTYEVSLGDKAFSGYLGADRESWKGKKDNFYVDKQLLPENLVAACTESKMEVVMRMQEVGLRPQLFFIATFMEDHIRHHARLLNA
ncbi:S-formylglutathione hydrolase [Apostichopus japonicus]|uniref:S-formylglutathione hydrolase n=1 Tax=Stichopus japonicus TaxID=307972 RepID=A0A2G8L5W0_STIJA|nr:S-formylglutathione hydrolase [Apostichopus japonicus]